MTEEGGEERSVFNLGQLQWDQTGKDIGGGGLQKTPLGPFLNMGMRGRRYNSKKPREIESTLIDTSSSGGQP